MNETVIVIPPLLKHGGGPLAGPAALVGAATATGGLARVIDLNQEVVRRFRTGNGSAHRSGIVGDHARQDVDLDAAAVAWREVLSPILGVPEAGCAAGLDPVWRLCYGHAPIYRAAVRLAGSVVGDGWLASLGGRRPHAIGLSVTWTGQVVAALAVSILGRCRWPGVPVIWGGPWVTVMGERIARDPSYGTFIDGFVAGHAERTFEAIAVGEPRAAPGVFKAGSGRVVRALEGVPDYVFEPRTGPSTFPVETCRGCAWGRCAYCTYPAVEGRCRAIPEPAVAKVVGRAAADNAAVSVKDAMMTPNAMARFADLAGGAIRWAACARLDTALDRPRLRRLVAGGLATLELGIETLDTDRLRRLGKVREVASLDSLLASAAGLDLHLVLNTMYGFPDETAEAALRFVRHLDDLRGRFPLTRFSTERNLLDVQAASRMGRHPHRYGIARVISWPWSPSLGWDAPAWRADLRDLLTGHHVARSEAA
jgi:hypothetical protein